MPKVRTGSRWIMEKQAWVKRMYTCGYILCSYTHFLSVFVHACIIYTIYSAYEYILYRHNLKMGRAWNFRLGRRNPGSPRSLSKFYFMDLYEKARVCKKMLQRAPEFFLLLIFFFNYMTVNCKDHPFLFVNLFYTFCVQIF